MAVSCALVKCIKVDTTYVDDVYIGNTVVYRKDVPSITICKHYYIAYTGLHCSITCTTSNNTVSQVDLAWIGKYCNSYNYMCLYIANGTIGAYKEDTIYKINFNLCYGNYNLKDKCCITFTNNMFPMISMPLPKACCPEFTKDSYFIYCVGNTEEATACIDTMTFVFPTGNNACTVACKCLSCIDACCTKPEWLSCMSGCACSTSVTEQTKCEIGTVPPKSYGPLSCIASSSNTCRTFSSVYTAS